MKHSLPPYISTWRDRHGGKRFRFRKRGFSSRMMPDPRLQPEEFAHAYAEALGQQPEEKASAEYTLASLADRYFESSAYGNLAKKTAETYSGWITALLKEVGRTDVRQWTHGKAQLLIDAHKDSPGRAFGRKRALALLFEVARKADVIAVNPAKGLILPKLGDGAKRWPSEQIEKFREAWPIGTIERLAFELCLFTGQRISDIASMRRSQISDGWITQTQQKTKKPMRLPIHPVLQRAIDCAPVRGDYLIATAYGKKRSAAGASNWFSNAANNALGDDGYTAHGLRKTLSAMLADAGASDKMIQSITGHETASETARYTRSADQARLAKQALGILIKAERTARVSVKPSLKVSNLLEDADFTEEFDEWQSLGESNPSFQVENLAS